MGNNGTGYADEIWAAIKKEWLAGQLSISDIGRSFGPSRQAITKRAKEHRWPKRGSLVEQVRKEVESQLLEDDAVADEVTPSEAADIVESAAKRGVMIVRRERKLLARLLGVADATLKELEEMQVISRETLEKKRTKACALLVASLSKAKVDGMRAVSQVLSQAIPLERLAYSLDKDNANAVPIKYEAPSYKKPKHSGLSEDQWG